MRPPLLRTGALTLAGTLAASGLLVAIAAPASAADSPSATSQIVINEVESNLGSPDDWVELGNPTGAAIDATGLVFSDNRDEDVYRLPTGSVIPAGGFLTIDTRSVSVPDGFDFGLGGADSARLFESDGVTLIDSYSWTAHAATTYGRNPDFTGPFETTAESTKNAPNVFATNTPAPEPTDPASPEPTDPPAPGTGTDTAIDAEGLSINEVESNGDDTDWVEITNTSSTPIDISGYGFVDSDDSHSKYMLPAGSIVDPGAFFVIDQETTTDPEGFSFGLGASDSVSLYDTTDSLDVTYSWTTHSLVTYGRCVDGTGSFTTTTTSTKGSANDCSSPIRINEVESDGGSPDDWVELTNIGAATVDISDYVLRDSEDDADHHYPVPAGTTVAPGAFVVLDTKTDSTPDGFDFGLGKADSARLFLPDDQTLVDSYSWTAHSATTYGRNPDGTGDFETTSEPTKGAANLFAGTVVAETWPGSPDETPLDDEDTYTGDLSGLDYEPDATDPSADGTIWGVENGNGKLYKIVSDGEGGWAPATSAGFADGKTLHYADGTGTVDAEGVTVADDSSKAGVYVSSERNNDVSSVGRPSVLLYSAADLASSATTINATKEWNLAADFPGLGANSGLEGVTWIPDSFLTGKGFVDQSTGRAYSPSDYAGHGDGLFFVAVEGTASVYAYALLADGSFQRVATIATGFPIVADVQFDADLGQLWVVCDDACSGQTALFSIDGAGAFTRATLYNRPSGADAALANEGFAIAPSATSVDGQRLTFYADDNDTDGYSFRVGSYPSAGSTTPGDGSGDGDGDGSGNGGTPGAPGSGGTPGTGTGGGTPGSGGSGSGSTPRPLPADALTAANRGDLTLPTTAVAGQPLTIGVGVKYAGQTVSVYLYSTPRLIGTATVSIAGTVTVTIPADTPAGEHRIAVYDAAGTLIGWAPVTITAAATALGDPSLAYTGSDPAGAALLGGLLVALGVAAMAARRRSGGSGAAE